MDPERIQRLTEEVLSKLDHDAGEEKVESLEGRVAALERAVFSSKATPAAASPAALVVAHPSHHYLRVVGGVPGEPCLIEPDTPCTQSRRCQALGY